jgi:serine/threonine protein kinase
MTRVVRGLDSGEAVVPGSILGRVPYIIFEMAPHGDIRRHMASLQKSGSIDIAWKLRALHHIAVGILQLHSRGVAHQDLKPSNVLVFDGGCKIGDLGCSTRRGIAGPLDNLPVAGDLKYSPIECFYGIRNQDWDQRRGHDMFLLGSMIVFMFANVSMLALIEKILDPKFYPSAANNDYNAVLPYIQNAFAMALADFRTHIPDQELASALSQIISELCNPDPTLRGIPQVRGARPRFAAEVYVSRLNRLARREELATLKAVV